MNVAEWHQTLYSRGLAIGQYKIEENGFIFRFKNEVFFNPDLKIKDISHEMAPNGTFIATVPHAKLIES